MLFLFFLSCNIGTIPFMLWETLVGASPWRRSTYSTILEKLRMRLSTWQERDISIGWKVILMNTMINNIPIFFFSFFKAPKVILMKTIGYKLRQCLQTYY